MASTAEHVDSVSQFVQKFYDWYAPLANRGGDLPPWASVLQQKESALSPRLAAALRADYEAQSKAEGEIVGLDFDPFLGSQDPCDYYRAGKVSPKGQSYSVEVRSTCAEGTGVGPAVVAELVPRNGSWVFDNFYYPSAQSDLLSVLRQLKSGD